MIKRRLNRHQHHQVVVYLRMSTKHQNPRSPDQQLQEIKNEIRRLGVPWEIVRIYRDDGISGRKTRQRPQFVAMMNDLRSGKVKATLLLVDTLERLTRAEDGIVLREKLKRRGVLVLTADSCFADPTSVEGRALGLVEHIRATTDGEVKAHNVLRGKRDAVRLKQWPGGPPPMGYHLQPVMTNVDGISTFSHNTLAIDSAAAIPVRRMFELADTNGFGPHRISRVMNADSTFDEKLKPFHESTIAEILRNEIYYGELVWGQNCTDIVNDVRKVEPVAEEYWTRVPEFCEPLVSREQWQRVRSILQFRSDLLKQAKSANSHAARPGSAIQYPLSGLVICHHCGRVMVASSGKPYKMKSGATRRYVYYGCPAAKGGSCTNRRRIDERWLRGEVLKKVKNRLHLDECKIENPTFVEFVKSVQLQVDAALESLPDPTANLRSEREPLRQQCEGWAQSLSKSSIDDELREDLERRYAIAKRRINLIDDELSRSPVISAQLVRTVNPNDVALQLQFLAEILAGDNAPAANVLLAQHIDTISCSGEGACILRMSRLGALAGAINSLNMHSNKDSDSQSLLKRRRRSRVDTGTAFEDEELEEVANEFATNPNRFSGLDQEWFTEDLIQVPQKVTWAQRNAREVAEFRLAHQATIEQTAAHFRRSNPIIHAALRIALSLGIDARGKQVSQPRRPSWKQRFALAVLEYFDQPGSTLRSACKAFGKSEPTIRDARLIGIELAKINPNTGGSDRAA